MIAVSQTFRVRPFRVFFDFEVGPQGELVGAIRDGSLLLTIFGEEIRVPNAQVDQDERGPFAIVAEDAFEVAPGFRVRTQLEHDELLDLSGGQIAMDFGANPRERLEQRARAQGLDPSRLLIIGGQGERGVSVYFDSDGHVNGKGGGGPAPQGRRPN
jgi:hypothetical protein